MACIIYRTDASSGRTYAYSSESYWDKEKQQPRSKRKYLGRVDPETGEIVKSRQTGKNYSWKAPAGDESTPDESPEVSRLKSELEQKNAQLLSLREEVKALEAKVKRLSSLCKKVSEMTAKAVTEEA